MAFHAPTPLFACPLQKTRRLWAVGRAARGARAADPPRSRRGPAAGKLFGGTAGPWRTVGPIGPPLSPLRHADHGTPFPQMLRKEALLSVRALKEATRELEEAKRRAPKLPSSLDLDALFGGDILTAELMEETTEIGIGRAPSYVPRTPRPLVGRCRGPRKGWRPDPPYRCPPQATEQTQGGAGEKLQRPGGWRLGGGERPGRRWRVLRRGQPREQKTVSKPAARRQRTSRRSRARCLRPSMALRCAPLLTPHGPLSTRIARRRRRQRRGRGCGAGARRTSRSRTRSSAHMAPTTTWPHGRSTARPCTRRRPSRCARDHVLACVPGIRCRTRSSQPRALPFHAAGGGLL